MLVGVDVGGTYTDAALISGGRVARVVKVPTRQRALLDCLLTALDNLLSDIPAQAVERVVFSTTLVTNLIVQGQLPPVGLLLLPGPGVNPALYGFPEPCRWVPGAVDYRGREIVPLDEGAVASALQEFTASGVSKVAIVGKFSSRNPAHELAAAALAKRDFPALEVELGHRVAGQLNFPRRAVTTRLTLATRSAVQSFLDEVARALRERGIGAPAFLLKADGGALPLEAARTRPVETVFSGPAASALGGMALAGKAKSAVVVDIGGTTTDLALILNGRPLLASRGAKVEGYFTQVRALAVRSVPIGGDSAIKLVANQLTIGPQRLGPAYGLGGPVPTPTDALRVLGLTELGDRDRALAAMAQLAASLNLTPEQAAERVVSLVVTKIKAAIEEMFVAWEQEPAYRVWEIMQGRKGRPRHLIGVGGAAPALLPRLAAVLGLEGVIPPQAASANAIGAALAVPTVYLTLHADTERGTYSVEELGFHGSLPHRPTFSLDEACALAREHLRAAASSLGASGDDAEVLYAETFNVVRGWVRSGRIFHVVMQLAPGLVENLEEG